MAGVNKVILIGNLGKDPELKYLEGNIARVSFSLATTEAYKDKTGNRIEHTEWHNIVMWRTNAENAEKMLKKGMQIYVEGKIQSRQWNDKEGQKRNVTEIMADTFRILQRRENSSSQNPQGGFDTDTNFDDMSSKDLPF
ncbi:MAG: single-stranded DNA-binding protein [Bacteroidota bacterium]|nr:single-stranded DNA-binding protein [Bacteroidota bacterium]